MLEILISKVQKFTVVALSIMLIVVMLLSDCLILALGIAFYFERQAKRETGQGIL